MAEATVTFVGFYGCATADRTVRVGSSLELERARGGQHMRTFPRPVHEIVCPGCGREHFVSVEWRRKTDYDRRRGLSMEAWL